MVSIRSLLTPLSKRSISSSRSRKRDHHSNRRLAHARPQVFHLLVSGLQMAPRVEDARLVPRLGCPHQAFVHRQEQLRFAALRQLVNRRPRCRVHEGLHQACVDHRLACRQVYHLM